MKIVSGLVAAALTAGVAAAQEASVVRRDEQFYSQGVYVAYASPWGVQHDSALKPGVDYADSLVIQPARFPAGTAIYWRWPGVPARNQRPYGYMALSFGSYAGGRPQTPVTPRRVRAIATLRQDFNWTRSVWAGDMNLLTEFYLTRRPGDFGSKVLEVGWFLRVPASTARFVDAAQQVGRFTDRYGRTWQVALSGTFCTFTPVDRREIPVGSIDMREALVFLRTKGLVTGEEWFSGVGFGVEPLSGAGNATVHFWGVTYN